MQKTEIEITKQNPELLKDVNLFKIVLTPSELYTLKYFLFQLSPLNIRRIYVDTINLLFHYIFEEEQTQVVRQQISMINDLLSIGYGGSIVKSSEAEKIFKELRKKGKFISATELTKFQLEKLKQCEVKIPSYDKFQSIFARFEKIGIIYRIAREGKVILYGLNPHFYNYFKDKIEDIKKL